MTPVSIRANRKYPSLPGITGSVESHTRALGVMVEAIAIHERRTKDYLSSFVRVQELIDLGLARVEGSNFVSDVAGDSVRYLVQDSEERFWSAAEFIEGTNIIGVRYVGESFVYLPNGLPTEHIIVVKDETGGGQVVVRIY